jgi:hypothetical protein
LGEFSPFGRMFTMGNIFENDVAKKCELCTFFTEKCD